MARKQKHIVITSEGRDKGKAFLITEMPASQAEEWAGRALFALMNAGVDIPEDIAAAGLSGIAAIGIKALGALDFDRAKPLFDQMMTCVQIDMGKGITRALIEDDIEEIATRLLLRKEVAALHLDFLQAAEQ